MKHYELQKDEVALFHSRVLLQDGNARKNKPAECELILTNFNFVFTVALKSLFKKEYETQVFELKTVKFYKNSPHIIRKDKVVEIYFADCEKFVEFEDKKNAKAFLDKAMATVSGYSKFVRAVKKTQQAIEETDEALNIDIMGAAKTVASVATGVALNADKITNAKGKGGKISTITKLIARRKDEPAPALPSADNKIQKVKELKSLLDEGVITEEEFNRLKEECLNG